MKAVILEAEAVNPGDISWAPVTDLCETKLFAKTTEETKWDRFEDVDIVLTNKVVIDEAVFTRFPQIRYVGVCATGYNVVDLAAAKKHGVTVTNVPAYSTRSVAQHTFALLLDLTSKISMHAKSVADGGWIRSDQFCYWIEPVMELDGKTIGIFGFGNIGREVAKIAQSFGMKVLVTTAHPENYRAYETESLQFVPQERLFAEADVISLHCPLTAENAQLIRKETIAQMKDGVILINVARGGLVNEADLADALRAGKIAGAGVDVISREPMQPDNPLIDAPNLLITPHIAWASKEARERLVQVVADNIHAWMDGAPVNTVSA